VWRGLEALPLLRSAYLGGELGFSVARLVVGLATPETEAACLATVGGRTLRAVEAIVRAAKEAETEGVSGSGDAGVATPEGEDPDEEERVAVRLPCTAREAGLWVAALELARRMAGESLPVWRCAEWIAAEAASALGGPQAEGPPGPGEPGWLAARSADRAGARPHSTQVPRSGEHGLRAEAFPGVSWKRPEGPVSDPLAELARGAEDAMPREIDHRLQAAIAFLQSVDLEMGRVLRQMVDRRLFAEIGFEGLERYAAERLDLSARTARRLVALARTEYRAQAVATAFREGRIHAFQAQTIACIATPPTAEAWVERAEGWTLRRLEDEVEARRLGTAQSPDGSKPGAALARPAVIAFHAPSDVAALVLAMLDRAGSLERSLAHAIATWVEQGEQFEDYADFERDGFLCAVPGCTCRRNLHSHHLEYRSVGGPDVPENRITLCGQHHLRAVHGDGTLRIRGRSPDGLVFELGAGPPERFRSGDVRIGEGSA